MSDFIGKLTEGCVNMGANRPVEPFQSVRAMHQPLKSRMEETNLGNDHTLHHESQAQDYIANKQRSIFRSENDATGSESSGFAEVTEARTVRIMKKGFMASSETLIHERFGRRQHTIFNLRQDFKSSSDGKNELNLFSLKQVARSPIDCNSEYNAFTAPHTPLLKAAPLRTEIISKVPHRIPEHYENNTEVILHDSLALGGPSGDKFAASNQMTHRIDVENLPELSSVRKRKMHAQLGRGVDSREDMPSSSFTPLGHEHHTYHSSTFLASRGKEVDRQSTSRIHGDSFMRRSYTPFPLQDPFYGNNHSIEGVGEHNQKIHGFSGNEIVPSQSNHPEPIIREKLHGKSLLWGKTPYYVHDAEAMTSYNPNSPNGSAGGTASVPQRTSKLMLMDDTDFNLSKKSCAFWESNVPGKGKRKASAEFLASSSGMGQRVEFHPPDIVIDCAEKDEDNIKSPEIPSKNDSYADTDTMDIGDLKEQTDLSGINSSPSHKMMTLNQPSEVKADPVGDGTKCRRAINTLPDINEELPVQQAAFSLTNKATASTSRTLTLDADHLISPPQQTKPKSSNPSSTTVETDPSIRWLKRLGLGSSDSLILGTDCPSVEQTMSHKYGDNLSSQAAKGKNICSSVDREALLSESWIKRWCCNQPTPVQQPQAVASCDPQSSKEESDKLQNKPFPSFAAMALMGRAMTGFRPCEFQSRGSFVVWKTNNV